MAEGFEENLALLSMNGLEASLRMGRSGGLVLTVTASSAGAGAATSCVLELRPLVALALAQNILALLDEVDVAAPVNPQESEEGPAEGF